MAEPPLGRRLVLVRHARTAWNAEGRAQGHADVSLDDVGRTQAEAMAPAVASYDPVVLVSSDLARARETAAFLEKETGLTALEDARLREYDLGVRTGMTREEFVAHLGDDSSRDQHAHVDVAGAETQDDVAGRIVPALHDVLAGLAAGESAVVVSHGACLKIAVAGVLGLPVKSADVLVTLDNCAWVVLEDSAHGPLRLASYNLTAGA